jgi:hypothetical protein
MDEYCLKIIQRTIQYDPEMYKMLKEKNINKEQLDITKCKFRMIL